MSDHITTLLCAMALAAALGASYLLDGPSDTDAAQAVAADVIDAQHTAQHATQSATAYAQAGAQ